MPALVPLRQSSSLYRVLIFIPTTIAPQRPKDKLNPRKKLNGAVREPDVSTELRSILLVRLFALASNYSAFNHSAPNYSSPWAGVGISLFRPEPHTRTIRSP
jgi:hypothetical protein